MTHTAKSNPRVLCIGIPVRDLTITFLYDHDAHSAAYLAAMKKHYPTRGEFSAELDKFLRNPANQH